MAVQQQVMAQNYEELRIQYARLCDEAERCAKQTTLRQHKLEDWQDQAMQQYNQLNHEGYHAATQPVKGASAVLQLRGANQKLSEACASAAEQLERHNHATHLFGPRSRTPCTRRPGKVRPRT